MTATRLVRRASALAILAALTGAAAAADLPTTYRAASPDPVLPSVPDVTFFNEIRIGGAAHGVGTPERGTADINGELLTRQIFTLADPTYQALVPRLHIGGSGNLEGRTNYGYAGLTWTYDILPKVFIEGSFGGSYNDGKTGDRFTFFDEAKLGCHVLFRESASLGYRFDEHWSIMATADHLSNGGLCKYNRGLNNYGVRLGYSF